MATKRATRVRKREFEDDDSIIKALADRHNKFEFKFKKREFKFTDNQKKLMDIIHDPDNKIIIIEGPAGTSKTLCAVYCGLTMLKDESMKNMLYIRSVIESGSKSLGYLPGLLSDKLLVWQKPLEDKLNELVESKDISHIMTSNRLEVMPINYVRGSSWRDSFVIFDEFQNTTIHEAKTLLTRIGEGSKLILCGDADQSDLRDSGFGKVLDTFSDQDSRDNGVVVFRFTDKDIVRSDIARFVVKKFKAKE